MYVEPYLQKSGGQGLLDQTTVSTAISGAEEISFGLTQATEVNYNYKNTLEKPIKRFCRSESLPAENDKGRKRWFAQ